jgi:hypothetical protein
MRNDTVKRRYIYGIGFRKREFAWAAPGREDHLYREDRLSSADSVSAGRGVCPFFMISSADAVSAD